MGLTLSVHSWDNWEKTSRGFRGSTQEPSLAQSKVGGGVNGTEALKFALMCGHRCAMDTGVCTPVITIVCLKAILTPEVPIQHRTFTVKWGHSLREFSSFLNLVPVDVELVSWMWTTQWVTLLSVCRIGLLEFTDTSAENMRSFCFCAMKTIPLCFKGLCFLKWLKKKVFCLVYCCYHYLM